MTVGGKRGRKRGKHWWKCVKPGKAVMNGMDNIFKRHSDRKKSWEL